MESFLPHRPNVGLAAQGCCFQLDAAESHLAGVGGGGWALVGRVGLGCGLGHICSHTPARARPQGRASALNCTPSLKTSFILPFTHCNPRQLGCDRQD